ncbi:MAG: tetratricopeptide repeat protein [Bacteroidetes bacterium]|nr:tetratricopeptide repeat protein [Bacteroidota bacterium]
MNILSELANQLQKHNNHEASFEYIRMGIELGEKLKHNRELALLYKCRGDYNVAMNSTAFALQDYNKAMDIETAAGRKDKMAMCYDKIARLYQNTGQYEKAVSNYQDELKLYTTVGDTSKTMDVLLSLWDVHYKKIKDAPAAARYLGEVHTLIGNSSNPVLLSSLDNKLGKFYSIEGDFEKAAEYLNKALPLHSANKDYMGMVSDYYEIARLYEKTGNHQKAFEYYIQVLKIQEARGTKLEQALALNNAGWGYQLISDYPKALEFQLKSYKIFLDAGEQVFIAYPLGNLGIIYNQLGAFNTAIEYSEKAMALFLKNKDFVGVAESYNNIGSAYLNLEKTDSAMANLQKGLQVAKDENVLREIKNSYSGLASACEQKKDYRNAYNYFRLYARQVDIIMNQDNAESVRRMQFSIENEKNQKTIELLSMNAQIKEAELRIQRVLTYAAVTGLLLMLTVVFFVLRARKQKHKADEQMAKLNAELFTHKEKTAGMG